MCVCSWNMQQSRMNEVDLHAWWQTGVEEQPFSPAAMVPGWPPPGTVSRGGPIIHGLYRTLKCHHFWRPVLNHVEHHGNQTADLWSRPEWRVRNTDSVCISLTNHCNTWISDWPAQGPPWTPGTGWSTFIILLCTFLISLLCYFPYCSGSETEIDGIWKNKWWNLPSSATSMSNWSEQRSNCT